MNVSAPTVQYCGTQFPLSVEMHVSSGKSEDSEDIHGVWRVGVSCIRWCILSILVVFLFPQLAVLSHYYDSESIRVRENGRTQ